MDRPSRALGRRRGRGQPRPHPPFPGEKASAGSPAGVGLVVRHAGPRLPDDGSKDEPGGDGPGATLMKRRMDPREAGPKFPEDWWQGQARGPRGDGPEAYLTTAGRTGPRPPWRWARGPPTDSRKAEPGAPARRARGFPNEGEDGPEPPWRRARGIPRNGSRDRPGAPVEMGPGPPQRRQAGRARGPR